MSRVEHIAAMAAPAGGRRQRRLPLVLLLMFGLLVSLFHCAGDSAAFAHASQSADTMATTDVSGDMPEHLLPAHSGHCLSHVTALPATLIALPADGVPRAPVFAFKQAPASLAGLPLFKPPRA